MNEYELTQKTWTIGSMEKKFREKSSNAKCKIDALCSAANAWSETPIGGGVCFLREPAIGCHIISIIAAENTDIYPGQIDHNKKFVFTTNPQIANGLYQRGVQFLGLHAEPENLFRH
jgi:hypothetical protein